MTSLLNTAAAGLALGVMTLGGAYADEAGASPAGQSYTITFEDERCMLEIDYELAFMFSCDGGAFLREGVIEMSSGAPHFTGDVEQFLSNDCTRWPEIAEGETTQDVCWMDLDLREHALVMRIR
ncbi:hypothetical protein ABWI01_11390 [Oceanicaulis alexandrii]|uniref:hypothetical protein n=1 Tax=Oceanicaulis alexandrii TaxID=153233 RepID=UPI0035CEB614